MALAALRAGKHVWVEKPLALRAADGRELVETARAAGRTLFVDETFLYDPLVREMKRLIDAGTLGANHAWVFLTITLPLILPGIIAGMILSFARSMGEFGATITFVSNIPGETQTLPSAIYTLTQVPGGDAGALRLTVISVIISMGALLVSELLARKAGRTLHTAP